MKLSLTLHEMQCYIVMKVELLVFVLHFNLQAFLEAISSPPLISGDVTHHRTHPPAINESPPTPPQAPPLSPLTYPSPLPSLRSPGPLASITA